MGAPVPDVAADDVWATCVFADGVARDGGAGFFTVTDPSGAFTDAETGEAASAVVASRNMPDVPVMKNAL
ncbi:hypothetical protein AA18890_2131 [Komagataeibacter europaeus LMG 18890]|nr:hypothetical protein AA18890_2131 [Komagataeibacter europaeus LMG 18890]